MDFGLVNLVGPIPTPTPTREEEQPSLGSGGATMKQERSPAPGDERQQEPYWRASKAAKTTMGLQEITSPLLLLRSNHMARQSQSQCQEQMISFSSSSSNNDSNNDNVVALERRRNAAHISALPYYQRMPSSYSGRSMHVNLNSNGNGVVRGGGAFTATQWIELEHQALIYKYITSNVPVPSNLILPLKKSSPLHPFGFFPSLPPNSSFGWGSFHVGYAGDSTDPEPGRCRRTDGKKWRCSRDAVADQKYCERHINRGRHRSRKPVEGQLHQTGPATSSLNPPPPPPDSALPIRMQSRPDLVNPKKPITESSLVATKHPQPAATFGLVSSDSLLNPSSSRDSSYHPINHFINNWPKDPTRETKPEWTQLSMSTPATQPDKNLAVSPLRLAHEFEPPRHPNWVPITWGGGSDCSMMGGPLGEALTNTSSSSSGGSGKNGAPLSSLNLLAEGWDGSPQLGSSPTGVLQKSAFCSLSNSSSGSSPRADNNHHSTRKINVFDQVLGSTLA